MSDLLAQALLYSPSTTVGGAGPIRALGGLGVTPASQPIYLADGRLVFVDFFSVNSLTCLLAWELDPDTLAVNHVANLHDNITAALDDTTTGGGSVTAGALIWETLSANEVRCLSIWHDPGVGSWSRNDVIKFDPATGPSLLSTSTVVWAPFTRPDFTRWHVLLDADTHKHLLCMNQATAAHLSVLRLSPTFDVENFTVLTGTTANAEPHSAWLDDADPTTAHVLDQVSSYRTITGLTGTPALASSAAWGSDTAFAAQAGYKASVEDAVALEVPGAPPAQLVAHQFRSADRGGGGTFGVAGAPTIWGLQGGVGATADQWTAVAITLQSDATTVTEQRLLAVSTPRNEYEEVVAPIPAGVTTQAFNPWRNRYLAKGRRIAWITTLKAQLTTGSEWAWANLVELPVVPPYPADIEPHLRLTQRNDGLGSAHHPRLAASTGAPSSRQRSAAPRLGHNDHYR